MTESDLAHIESELSIKLPDTYRSFMTTNIEEPLSRNQDYDLWDDALAIIRRNKELRAGELMAGKTPWPNSIFFIGDPLTACANALDLSKNPSPVLWVDHCDLSADSSGVVADDFVAWADSIVDELY